MTNFSVIFDCENEMVDELMAEGFRDPLSPRRELVLVNRVTVAS